MTIRESNKSQLSQSFTPKLPNILPGDGAPSVNWLLRNTSVQDYIINNTPAGFIPKIMTLMFDEQTEKLCEELGYDLIFPSRALRKKVDSKIYTTKIGNAVGIASVPNILTKVSSWQDLREQASAASLGEKLVIQLPYGHSGSTTFFISNEQDFTAVQDRLVAQELKVMRYISNGMTLSTEIVVTDSGCITGPILRELGGYPELTDLSGSWCGCEFHKNHLSSEIQNKITDLAARFSNQLANEGYRGIGDVSFLLDLDSGELYLGEFNPRLNGGTFFGTWYLDPKHPPLLAYHLLQFSGANLQLDTAGINSERNQESVSTKLSNMVIENLASERVLLAETLRSGVYRIASDRSGLEFVRPATNWLDLRDETEIFWLGAAQPGENLYRGAVLGFIFTRIQLQETNKNVLTADAKGLIRMVTDAFVTRKVSFARIAFNALRRRIVTRLRRD